MSTNYSYYLIPLVHLQTLATSIRFASRRLGFPNNVNPRDVIKEMEASGKLKKEVLDKIKRRQAAHENCFENEPIWICAILAGNQVGLSTTWMNTMSVAYFVLRCIYIYSYINISTQKRSIIRTIAYWTSNFCFLATFVKAGLKFNSTSKLL
ncbi:hypothetical protein I203_108032 [Kwoniella mangroviensis CBS 8507]|uniref:hypothetical protein n=1 Tax=Kwoniella mangroviensis CBS 8507 TaxID=1296122 RepID=UPI00080D6737|nr:uncharacterized protein I203_04926 [Kwoniella mangroviensis CBS 8507]OCF65906.1 hypothetical protein I203_04926 [Kwoniella mangroviensis CBS 8507]